jgi:lipid-A-disaccharide synthase
MRFGLARALSSANLESGLKRSPTLLVVAGEASGDAMAAPVVARLGLPTFGLGGSALRAAGAELCGDLSQFTAMGFGAVVGRSPLITLAAIRIVREVRRRDPAVALLVGYSEFNRLLGAWLRTRGVRVLWYGAPQIWAWRSGRAASIAAACDRMAVILPFERELWQRHGVDAHYVGHPVLERSAPTRSEVRERFGLTPYAEYVALLPGSRPHELQQHLRPMVLAAGLIRAERGALDARVILAPSLDVKTRQFARRWSSSLGVSVLETTAPAVLPAFDVAIAASGTVTLECAVAAVPPVIVYKTPPLTHWMARRLVRVPHVGLPNILLGARVFPELLQDQVTPERMGAACTRLLEHRSEYVDRCAAARDALLVGLSPDELESGLADVPAPREPPSVRVAKLFEPWI